LGYDGGGNVFGLSATGNLGTNIMSVSPTGLLTTALGLTATTGPITATAGNITSTVGDITATLGNITATAGNITATAGNITSTVGNLVANDGVLTVTDDVAGNVATFTGGDATDNFALMNLVNTEIHDDADVAISFLWVMMVGGMYSDYPLQVI